MISTPHTQSLADFRQTADETLDRLNQTGEAEILTVDGEVRAVLLSPAVYDEMAREAQLTRDVANIRKSMEQFDAGLCQEAGVFFDELHAKLLVMKSDSHRIAEK